MEEQLHLVAVSHKRVYCHKTLQITASEAVPLKHKRELVIVPVNTELTKALRAAAIIPQINST